jgi:predicted  nucleic acid-binding Zn-ribbon protein
MIRGEPLYELQNLDLELETSQQRISEIQASLGETEALLQARRELAAAEEEHRTWMTRTRDLELEIEGLNNKIGSSEKRLYGGSVTNPKELSDIQSEIASLKRRRAAIEDELLEALIYGDEAEVALEDSRAALDDIETNWRTDQVALENELDQLRKRLDALREEREQLRRSIDADDLTFYDKVRGRCGSITVTTLRDGVCGYCAVAPSSTKLKAIRSGRELLQCGNCGRILLDL